MPPKLPLPHKKGFFFLFQNYPRSEGNCAAKTVSRQLLPRGIKMPLQALWAGLANNPDPVQRSKSPKAGKEGSESKNPHFPSPQKRAFQVKKTPILYEDSPPKGPGRIKNTTTYSFTTAVLIHYLWGDLLCIFPGKTRCFRDPGVLFYYRRIFLPP